MELVSVKTAAKTYWNVGINNYSETGQILLSSDLIFKPESFLKAGKGVRMENYIL